MSRETVEVPGHIKRFHSEAAAALSRLKKHFEFPMKATLILRNSEDEACDVFVSEDEMSGIEALLERTKEREKTAVKLI